MLFNWASQPRAQDARALTGYQTAFNSQEHVDYISADGHVRELFFDTSWHPNDLTAAARAVDPTVPNAPTSSALNGFTTPADNLQHVNYISADGHVREFFLLPGTSNWRPNDLIAAARLVDNRTPVALATSALAGYVTTFNNQQHVDYISADGHVHELFLTAGSSSWNPRDLTQIAMATVANPASPLTGFQTTFNNQQHVDFIDNSGHVVELFFGGDTWHPNDLTVAGGLNLQGVTAGTIALDGYQTTSPNQQHVNFIATGPAAVRNHVFELFFNDGGAWLGVDLTATAIAPWVNATGTWQVPQVGKPLQGPDTLSGNISLTDDGWDSSTWVGINGNGTNDVLQAGTEQTLLEDGSRQFVAWFEWFVAGASLSDKFNFPYIDMQTIGNISCSPGDTFQATISYAGPRGFITLVNLSTGQGFAQGLEPPPNADFSGRTAEWIMESPTEGPIFGSSGLAAMPSFTPVVFKNATATDFFGVVAEPSNAGRDPSLASDSNIIRQDFLGGDLQISRTTSSVKQTEIDFIDWYDHDLSANALVPAGVTATGRIMAFATSFNNLQHIVFAGSDRHVHELFFPTATNTWGHNDLTAITSSPLLAVGSSLTGYETTFNTQMHVDFVSSDGHVRELWFDNAWHPNDLTVAARLIDGTTPLARTTSSLNGYQTPFNRQQHVDYISADGHVRELWHDVNQPTTWHPTDLTVAARQTAPATPLALLTTALNGYATVFNSQQHVNFISANGHVNELWHDVNQPTTWHFNDLTLAAPGAPLASLDTPLDGYTTDFNSQQHVNYVAQNGNVFELFFDNPNWHFSNLSALAGVPNITAATGASGALAGYTTTFNQQQHVDFRSTVDDHVHELFFTGSQWLPRDLTSVPGSPAASGVAAASKLTGYQTLKELPPLPGSPAGSPPVLVDTQHHVNYVSPDGHVHELIHGP
jgi:hypothetical protein